MAPFHFFACGILPLIACVAAADQDPDEAEWLAFELRVEERLELEPLVVALHGEALELRLEFHGPLALEDGTALAWDADRRRPYVRAALRWLQVVRGAKERDQHTLTLHLIALPFDFGNGFASPLYESLEPIGEAWLPTEALIGINTMLYAAELRELPDIRKEHYDNALHEIGHALGIGSLWNLGRWDGELDAFAPQDLADDPPEEIVREWVVDSYLHEGLIYEGPAAVAAFRRVHETSLDVVPISSDAGHLYALFDEERPRKTADGETVPASEHELMSHRDALSEISVGFLEDLGWAVDYAGADPLPTSTSASTSATPERLSLPGPLAIVPPGDDPLAPLFAKRVDVLGVRVLATEGTSDRKLLHAASILAEYLDNDEDGEPDDENVIAALREGPATLVMFRSDQEAERVFERMPWDELEDRVLQDLYDDETHPGGAEHGRFDAAFEEVLHLVTHGGYARAYPAAFGEEAGSELAMCMDLARGGHFERVPARYPDGAWYTYDDRTCEYECQAAEYVYWGLTSLLGAQSFDGRRREIEREWRLVTPVELAAGDPGLFALLTDPRWNLPTRLPNGVYRPPESR
jgi:hypothetical protein